MNVILMSSLFTLRDFVKILLELLLPFHLIWNGDKNKLFNSSESNNRVLAYEDNILSKDVNKTTFYLYPDPNKLNYTEILVLGDADSVLKKSHYKNNLPLIILIHGFLTNFQDEFAQLLKNAFLDTNFPANIVAFDWGNLSTPKSSTPYIYYNLAVANVPIVANRTAEFILFLHKIKAVESLDRVQLIGFSLGAHVVGVTGKLINETISKPIGRITGLDPAAPLFQTKTPKDKLQKTDGKFVDVYHSNQGTKGYVGLLGHVDFFPNGGGPFQPGCSDLTDFSDIFTGSCSHARAYMYYAKSIRNSSIIACKCQPNMNSLSVLSTRSYVDAACKTQCTEPVIFGQFCPNSARGIYYIEISS